MQIHEMFQRKTLTEVDLVGPSSIFNVGKQALKDPKSWISSKALGAAQQRAADQYGRANAPKLAQVAQANISPLAKQLAQGWRQIGSQLPAPISAPTTVPGTAAPSTPAAPTTPAANLNTLRQQIPGQPTQADYDRLEKRIQQAQQKRQAQPVTEDAAADYRTAFIQYARKVLGARGIDTKAIGFDPTTNQELNRILSQITASHNDPDKQQQAVEKYFTTALNKWHEIQSNPAKYNQAFSGSRNDSSDGSGNAVAPGETNKDLDSVLRNIGITPLQLAKLGQAAVDASKGNREIRSTGNPVWDAVLKTAGMRV